MPCHVPPHRDTPQSHAGHRLAMAKLACRDVPGFTVDDWEILRDTPSFTVDTLQHLRSLHGAVMPLVFIMGMDAFNTFSHWNQWQEILQLSHLWIAHRPGSKVPDKDAVEANIIEQHAVETPAELLQSPAGKLFIYETTVLDISATKLRQDIAQGHDPRFLLPDTVWSYIQQHSLYRSHLEQTL